MWIFILPSVSIADSPCEQVFLKQPKQEQRGINTIRPRRTIKSWSLQEHLQGSEIYKQKMQGQQLLSRQCDEVGK